MVEDQRGPKTTDSDLEKVAGLWSETTDRRVEMSMRGWMDADIVLHNYVHRLQSGDDHVLWLNGVVEALGIPRGGHWLSLGCGAAATELLGAKAGLFATMDALDAAEESIKHARSSWAEAGVEGVQFGSVDLNRPSLERDAYDVVMICMSLHHVRELEVLLDEVAAALRPGGYFIFNEYVGPTQFQFSAKRLDIISRLLQALPDAMAIDVESGLRKTSYVVHPRSFWNEVDPSEAVRSDEILALVEERFDVLHRRDYGGTLLGPGLENIIHNFDPEDEKDCSLIRLLGTLEQILIENGVVSNDFTVVGARRQLPRARREVLLTTQIEELQNRLAERDRLIATIFESRSWRLLQFLRRLLPHTSDARSVQRRPQS